MIRILIFILSAIFVASMATWFASMESRFVFELFGAKISMPTGLALGLLLAGALSLVAATNIARNLAALPNKIKTRERELRRERGVAALTRGLEAVAVGDASDAQHHARVARRNLDDTSLTRLLTAQAAQLAGDDAAATKSFSAMLEAPETEFLGLRGLYAKAMRAGDKAAARQYAERAFKLRPNAGWAFKSVFELGLERGSWGEMREALSAAAKNQLLKPKKAARAEAVLLTADAYAADLSGDDGLALKELEAALKLAPGFSPAAVLAAHLHDENGKTSRGAKILEQAFADTPQGALIQAHINLYTNEPDDKRADRLKRIIDRAPTSREAKIGTARRHILLGENKDAISLLEPLLVEAATARECAIMAEAMGGAYGETAPKPWLERAAAAPRDPHPGADGVFHYTRDGWARLVQEYMEHGRLAPPPLEEAPFGISSEEIRLLLAPPPMREPESGDGQSGSPENAATTMASEADNARPVEKDLTKVAPGIKNGDAAAAKNDAPTSPEDGERTVAAAREVN